MIKFFQGVATLCALFVLPVQAHEGHEHSETPASASAQPRFETRSDIFELVGRLDGHALRLHIDRYATNEPVAKANIELASGNWKASAKPQPDGSFLADAGALAQVGKYPLVISVTAGAESDLLDATLDVAGHEASPAPAAGMRGAAMTAVALVAAVLAAATLYLRRRRRS